MDNFPVIAVENISWIDSMLALYFPYGQSVRFLLH